MFGNVGRRLVEGVVGLFAVLGFLYVPLGHHTGFEHACAIFTTPAASAALADVTATALDLRKRALDLFSGKAPEALPKPREANAPRPVPPKLR